MPENDSDNVTHDVMHSDAQKDDENIDLDESVNSGTDKKRRGRPKKGKRGRPPLNKPKLDDSEEDSQRENTPQKKQEECEEVSDEQSPKQESKSFKKKRGRPRKTEQNSSKKSRIAYNEMKLTRKKATKPRYTFDDEEDSTSEQEQSLDDESDENMLDDKEEQHSDATSNEEEEWGRHSSGGHAKGESGIQTVVAKKKRGRPRKSEPSLPKKSNTNYSEVKQLKGQVKQLQKELDETKKPKMFMRDISDPCELVPRLCAWMYEKGWASGSGGGVSIKQGDQIYMAPSGVQKEQVRPSEVFVLNQYGDVERRPDGDFKLTECFPLFMNAYQIRDAGAVLHSHSKYALLASMEGDEFTIKDMEMIKGIMMGSSSLAHKNTDTLVVPIINNMLHERDLTQQMKEVILKYHDTNAVLVRNHGVYIWGKDWLKAKTQAECYHYLFEIAVNMKQLGIKTS